jgi:hypothetical protein
MDGTKLTVKCSWSRTVHTQLTAPITLLLLDGNIVKDSVGIAQATGSDTRQTSFNVQSEGLHPIKCKIVYLPAGSPQGIVSDEKTVHVSVGAKKIQEGTWPTAPTSPPPAKSKWPDIAITVKPNLSVAGVQVKVEPNCQAPQPAMTAIVTIKNTGGALSGGKGSVFVKEIGGANLGSAGIPLPAIGAGQTQTVNIPATTPQKYSSLAGTHQVQVILNPQSANGQSSFNKPADPYVFSATFPSGYCNKK